MQGWAGIGGTKLGTTRFVRTASVLLYSEIHKFFEIQECIGRKLLNDCHVSLILPTEYVIAFKVGFYLETSTLGDSFVVS